jgi:hypothetical protein
MRSCLALTLLLGMGSADAFLSMKGSTRQGEPGRLKVGKIAMNNWVELIDETSFVD